MTSSAGGGGGEGGRELLSSTTRWPTEKRCHSNVIISVTNNLLTQVGHSPVSRWRGGAGGTSEGGCGVMMSSKSEGGGGGGGRAGVFMKSSTWAVISSWAGRGGASFNTDVMMSSGGLASRVVGIVGGATGFPKLELRDEMMMRISDKSWKYKILWSTWVIINWLSCSDSPCWLSLRRIYFLQTRSLQDFFLLLSFANCLFCQFFVFLYFSFCCFSHFMQRLVLDFGTCCSV